MILASSPPISAEGSVSLAEIRPTNVRRETHLTQENYVLIPAVLVTSLLQSYLLTSYGQNRMITELPIKRFLSLRNYLH